MKWALKIVFFLYFSLRNLFFSRCYQWLNTRFSLVQSKWRRTFLLFQHLQSLREPPVSFLCWEVAPWEQELRMFSAMLTEFCLKILDSLPCLYFIGNLIILLCFNKFFIKSYSDKFEAKSVLARQSLILPEAASFCR